MAEQGSLGPILKAARERVHLSQSELASRVGLAANHIARLESGEKGIPRFDTVARLAAELGLSLDDLSSACGYVVSTKLKPKDRTAIAQAANELAQVLTSVKLVENSLTSAIASLQRQAGLPELAPAPLRKGNRKRSPQRKRK